MFGSSVGHLFKTNDTALMNVPVCLFSELKDTNR